MTVNEKLRNRRNYYQLNYLCQTSLSSTINYFMFICLSLLIYKLLKTHSFVLNSIILLFLKLIILWWPISSLNKTIFVFALLYRKRKKKKLMRKLRLLLLLLFCFVTFYFINWIPLIVYKSKRFNFFFLLFFVRILNFKMAPLK